MKNKSILSLLSLFAVLTLGFKIDDTPLEKLLKQLAKLTATYPTEKVHLHLDKPYYAIGEDIWIKGYLVTAEKNEPSLLSKVLYVDLINEKNEIKKQAKLELNNGFANGQISLVDLLSSGKYRIRAYTNYMRNYDPSFFFEKLLTIGNVLDKETPEKPAAKKLELSLQFFPEGGRMVEGIRSKIGFKALTSDGLGANLSGYVVNKSDEKVAVFTSEHAGMGVFPLTPLPSEKYTALVTLQDGTTKKFDLPKAENSGYVFSVNNNATDVNIKISANSNLADGSEVYVVAQANGKSYASFASKMDNQNIVAKLKNEIFPTGIIQFTLFDATLNPIAERLVFINHDDALKIEIMNNSKESGTGKKTDFALMVTDKENSPIDGNFSVSVTDMDKVTYSEDEETTILSNLLLTSDLKGYIEQPNYYFNPANADRASHLDNLLLTQGWRRFLWKDVAAQKEPDINFRPEQSLEISGKIASLGDKPLPNAKVSLFSTTPGLFLKLDTVSDARGNFVFDRLDIPAKASFILQSSDKKNSKDVKIRVNQSPDVEPNYYAGQSIDIQPYIETTKKRFEEEAKYNMLADGIALKAVEIKTKLTAKSILNVPNSANASGAADQIITEKMLVGSINMLSPFYKIPGVMVKNGGLFNVRGRNSLLKSPPPYTIILDGMRVDQNVLAGINPADVAGIEVLSSGYNTAVYGEDGAGGVMHITSKRGGAGKIALATNTAKVNNAGFSATKEFYSPDYSDPKTNKQMTDLRTTIYWNPKIITDEKGAANFNFYNTSNPGNYRVTIEGMDSYGNLGRRVYTYHN